jgi:predicted RNA-binding Zn ribbon-like protein
MVAPEITPHFEFSAGAPVLNFLNTVWEREGYLTANPEPPHELLTSGKELLRWMENSGLRSTEAGIPSRPWRNLSEESQVLSQFVRTREIIFCLFRDVILKSKQLPDSLNAFNRLVEKLSGQRLIAVQGRFELDSVCERSLELYLEDLIRDACSVLCSSQLSRLRFCDADDCGWIFLDTSKNGKRRWCNMSDCGNRDKAKRFFERKRQANRPRVTSRSRLAKAIDRS